MKIIKPVGVLAGASLLLLSTAGLASAHVTVSASTTAAGADTTLTFNVPTESDTASTTSLAIYFPTNQPFADANVKPVPGWSFKVTTAKLAKPITSDDGPVDVAVSRIVWTADSKSAAIHPGEFQQFSVSAGPLPEKGTMTFKALQTYSDGSIVRWIDLSKPGQPEPDHPAPSLTITSATGSPSDSSTSGTSGTGESATPAATTTTVTKTSKTPLILSIIALIVAAGGAATAFVRRRA
jgi:periplasmic copper chaperone A